MLMMKCSVCDLTLSPGVILQFTPCLHVFCKYCVERWRNIRKVGSNSESPCSPKKTELPLICLASNCFSVFDENCNRRLNWKCCESQFCSRKLSPVWLECLPCKHNICVTCMEECKQLPTSACPVEGCSRNILDEDNCNLCDGMCKKPLEEKNFVITKCCQARICFSCFEIIFGRKHCPGAEESCSTDCIKYSDANRNESIARCQIGLKCENLRIIGFPSKGECEHAICVQCLEQMINDCESSGSLPRCPNESCNALYGTESVIAMRTMLPWKCSFFEKLSLDSSCYYLIKDDTITPIEFSANFKSIERCFEIDVKLSDGSESKKLLFDRKGTIADLVREIRRELNIPPEEKVYGYYLMRSLNDENKVDEDRLDNPAEKLQINAESTTESVEKLNLSTTVTVVADMTGIVQAKNDIALNNTGV